jgi:hypothetical protein
MDPITLIGLAMFGLGVWGRAEKANARDKCGTAKDDYKEASYLVREQTRENLKLAIAAAQGRSASALLMLPLIDQALKKLDMSAPFNSDGSRLEAVNRPGFCGGSFV